MKPLTRDSLSTAEIQRQLQLWQEHNFPGRPAWQPVMGVGEEAGELQHAFLKMSQSIRGEEFKHRDDMRDAIGDIAIFCMDVCNEFGWDYGDILSDTWLLVRQRNWRPEKGNLPEMIRQEAPADPPEASTVQHGDLTSDVEVPNQRVSPNARVPSLITRGIAGCPCACHNGQPGIQHAYPCHNPLLKPGDPGTGVRY